MSHLEGNPSAASSSVVSSSAANSSSVEAGGPGDRGTRTQEEEAFENGGEACGTCGRQLLVVLATEGPSLCLSLIHI